MHTHAGTLSDLARIKIGFESIRKEDLARYPVLIHTDEMFSNTFLPPAPPKSWCISVSFPSLNTNSRSCLTIPALRERRDFARCGPRSAVCSHTYSSKQPGRSAAPARALLAAALAASVSVKSDAEGAPFPPRTAVTDVKCSS